MSQVHPAFFEYLERVERQIVDRRFRDASATLLVILDNIEFFRWHLGGHSRRLTSDTVHDANRLAAAISSLATNSGYSITYGDVARFACYKRTIAQIFEISDHCGTAHLLESIGSRRGNGALSLGPQETAKLFLCLSLNHMSDALVDLLRRQPPGLAVPVILGMLSEQTLWSPLVQAARAKLLERADNWKTAGILPVTVTKMAPAYMGCSYADADHKHEIKRYLNDLAREYALAKGCEDARSSGSRRLKKRPTVVIPAELYEEGHAVHRIFGADIRSLTTRFETVLMTPSGTIDKTLTDLFSRVDSTAFDAANPAQFCQALLRHEPDIVYYPTVGMRFMSILLANLRLAPIQITTFGHPATTNSRCIDYAVVHDGVVVDESTLSETILVREYGAQFLEHSDRLSISPNIRRNPERIHVAVPAWQRKVTPEFLRTCREIANRAQRPVRFAFFPNSIGSAFQAFKKRVESMLPAEVLPSTNYAQYMQWLNQCDVFLSTFPFGATNGIIDAARLGLPVVNRKGREMHSMIDSLMIAELGAPDWLSTETVDEYIDSAVRLIDDDALRVSLSEQLVGADVRTVFLHDQDRDDFVRVFEAAYRHHEILASSGRKLWPYTDLVTLGRTNTSSTTLT